MALGTQVVWLFVMALAVACIAWTVTHEEIFSEPRDYCLEQSRDGRSFLRRKFFYLFTCEYCFSHYVAAFFVGCGPGNAGDGKRHHEKPRHLGSEGHLGSMPLRGRILPGG